MEDASLMGVVNGTGDGGGEPRGGAGSAWNRLDLGGEIAAVDELHAEIVVAFVLADLVDRHDVGVIERAAASASRRNRCKSSAVAKRPARTIFEGKCSVQADLPGLVDDTHAALARGLEELVIAEVADSRLCGLALIRERSSS